MKSTAKPVLVPWLAVLVLALLPLLARTTARAADYGMSLYFERFTLIDSISYRWTLFNTHHTLRYTGFGTATGPEQIEPINGRDVIQLQTWNTFRAYKGTGDYRRSAEVFPVGAAEYVLVARKVVPTPYVSPPRDLPDMGFFVQQDIWIEGEGSEGLTYHASGLPRGVSCIPSTGLITGFAERVGTYKVRRWTQRGKVRSEVRVSTLTVTPLPTALVGRYEALLRGADAEPFAHVSVAVAGNGTYSARLIRPGRPASALKSRFGYVPLPVDLNGNPAPSRIHGVSTPDFPGLFMSFNYDETGAFRVLTDEQLSDGSFGSRSHPGVRLAEFTAARPAPWGRRNYTLALRVDGAPASAPAGAGPATVSAAVTGVITIKGKTADGATITGAFNPTDAAAFRPFLLPAGQAGAYLAGDLKLRASSGSYYAGAADADLRWRKPALPKATYPSGFGPLRVVPRLAPWTRPTASILSASLGVSSAVSLDLVVTAPGVSNLGGNALGLPVNLLLDSKGRLVGEGADASRFSAKLDLGTGLVTGHVLGGTPDSPATARKHPFQAVLFQSAASPSPATLAEGYVLLPSAPTAQARSAYFRLLYVP